MWSSGGKFDLKYIQNNPKNEWLNKLDFLKKMVEDFHSYLCYFCNQVVYVVKISGDFYNFWRGLGVKTCKKWSKIKKSVPIFRIIVSVFVCYKCELL